MSRVSAKRTNGCALTLMVLALSAGQGQVLAQEQMAEFGRLFTDAAQRARLDAIRRGARVEPAEGQSTVTEVTVNGIMIRSDGESVVWVNGDSTLDGKQAEAVRALPRAADRESFKVPVKIDGKYVRMKPGQKYSSDSGLIKDDY